MSVRDRRKVCGTGLPRLWVGKSQVSQRRARPLRVGRALSGEEGRESWGWGCLLWPRGCAHVGVRCTHGRDMCTRGQECVHMWPGGCAHMAKRGVHTWLAGLVRRVYSGRSQPVVRTFSVMLISWKSKQNKTVGAGLGFGLKS